MIHSEYSTKTHNSNLNQSIMKQVLIISLLIAQSISVFSQKYMTQSGVISFYSEAPIENIESTNSQVSSVVNLADGKMAFSLLMKAFVFEKALMQTHFNEKYVESEIYPKATFKGQIQNFESIKLSTTPQEVTVKGKLTIHGETNEISTVGNISFNKDGQLKIDAKLEIALEDYKIKIPGSVKENISETISITIQMQYEKLD